jgi:uncharacterized protein YqeY
MSIYERIKTEQIEARKTKDTVTVNLLTTLLGDLQQNKTTDDQGVIRMLKKYKGTIEQTIDIYQQNGRSVAQLTTELNKINSYMPAELDNMRLEHMIIGYKISNPDAKIGQFMSYIADWSIQNNLIVGRKVASQIWNTVE